MDSLENGQKEFVVPNINLSVREHLGLHWILTNVQMGRIGGVLVRNVIELTLKSTIGMKGKKNFCR